MKKVIGTKLKFKGDNSLPKRKKIDFDANDGKRSLTEVSSSSSSASSSGDAEEENFEPVQGTGRITSGATIISGHYTKFMDELKPGDAIIISHPTSLVEEMKVVRIIVSNISMSISSAFSSDIISTTPFKYIKAPKDDKPTDTSSVIKTNKQDSEEAAFGTYASSGGEKFVYRVKKTGSFGGYKIVTEDTKTIKSREDLLNMRSKKKSDRFCY